MRKTKVINLLSLLSILEGCLNIAVQFTASVGY